ncbi:MAG TPA: helix-turn-helix domain-containing protein, partial [bacterium]|nr:helix-turn-helix domain-containing protein [bacterium]
WTQAFSLLAKYVRTGRAVLLFDEISWMAAGDKTFSAKLKIAWDTLFKTNPKLVLVLCGSVTSWMDQNILNNAAFVGRVSLTLTLQELPLHHCNEFWGKKKNTITSAEKFKILSVTGGVPRYLEEIKTNLSAEQNIKRLAYQPAGFLFSEFDNIFNSTFSRRAPVYREIVTTLVSGSKTFTEICHILKRDNNGTMSHYLNDLIESGFLKQDFVFSTERKKNGVSKYRLSDNYLRFYLKYIEPAKEQIKGGLYATVSLETLPGWDVIMGLQFENLILNNLPALCGHLLVPLNSVVSCSPYFQKTTQRKQACQIDLLIQTKNTIYVCEIKFKKNISASVIKEVQDKIVKLKTPKSVTIRPVLIYCGCLATELKYDDFFSHKINADAFLTALS